MLMRLLNYVILSLQMNRFFIFILLAILATGCQTKDVNNPVVDKTPVSFEGNDAFMHICLERYDSDADGVLTVYECEKVKELDVSARNLFSLKGIENFTGLETLFCYDNIISDLDVSALKKLKYLYCNNSNVHTLNVTGCSELLILDAHYNFLETLDVTSCSKMYLLSVCFNPRFSEIDLSACKALGTLYCQSCTLTRLDLSGCSHLIGLHCWGNQLTELNLEGCSNLMDLWCGDNNLFSLDLTSCPDKMQYISCPRNPGLMRVFLREGQTASSIELSASTGIIYK